MQNVFTLSAIRTGLLLLNIMVSTVGIQARSPYQISGPKPEENTPELIGTESKFFADIDTVNQRVYILLYEELWAYNLREEEWDLLHTFEKEKINILLSEPKEFGYDHVSGDILLWSTGVGLVCRIDLETYRINRIDQSFPHKNQFGHIPFFREGKIYAFGGYGFWQDKNLISHFKPDVKEWLIVAPAEGSPYPPERVGGFGTYVSAEDAFYAYGGNTIDNRRHDDNNSKRSKHGEIWKFDFNEMLWSQIMSPGPLEAITFMSAGPSNIYGTSKSTKSLTAYSNASKNWYIPIKMTGGDMANVHLKVFNLEDHTEFKPVEIDATSENAMISTHFLFNEKSRELVFVGFRNVTNSEIHPLLVLKIPESEVIAKLEPEDSGFTLVFGSLIVAGVFLIIGWLYFKKNGPIKVINGIQSKISKEELEHGLNKTEKELLNTLIVSDHMPETSELEEMVWPDVDNYDYRRKLRNETIRSINEKVKEMFDVNEELIIRQRDLEDNRRYRYGINEDLLG